MDPRQRQFISVCTDEISREVDQKVSKNFLYLAIPKIEKNGCVKTISHSMAKSMVPRIPSVNFYMIT